MVFSSTIFLFLFLPCFFLIYYVLSNNRRNYWLLISSIFFYSWGAPKFVFVIIFSTFIDFYLVKALDLSDNKKQRKILLALSIFLNLGLLLFFKYANFFVENVNLVLGQFGVQNLSWTKIALPIGISFYTFQTLTYSIDVYRRVHKPLTKLSDYTLYIMSFPQMIAGPIVRFNSIADQITKRQVGVDDKLHGFYRFCIGLGKKVLIANVMGEQADLIMGGEIESFSSAYLWVGILAYTFQIYFDFSGYSDMAIGLGRMMGFTFPENFNSPYVSKNISEFWRRWHITLGDFMREYLYIPLGGNRVKSKSRYYGNLWLVFLLSGLWHGASWNFILWGAFHGLFLILDRVFLIKLLNKLGGFISIVFTFLVVMIGWVLFRIENLSQAMYFIKKLFVIDMGPIPILIDSFKPMLLLAILFSFIATFNWGKKLDYFVFTKSNYSNAMHGVFTLLCLSLFVLSAARILSSGFNPFIYFRF